MKPPATHWRKGQRRRGNSSPCKEKRNDSVK